MYFGLYSIIYWCYWLSGVASVSENIFEKIAFIFLCISLHKILGAFDYVSLSPPHLRRLRFTLFTACQLDLFTSLNFIMCSLPRNLECNII